MSDVSYGEGVERLAPSLVVAAHELKSPLALIRQLALHLEDQVVGDEAKKLLQQMTLSTERALRLTSDITRSDRLEDSLFELEPLNPQQFCEDIAHEFMPLYAARGRELRVSSCRKRMLVIANKDLLRRIVANFVDNALHYGGDAAPVMLNTNTVEHGERIRLGVRDSGPRLSRKSWHTLVTQMKNGQQPLHSRPQSSGLGIYIATRFAEAMHADVGAVRHVNGATFYVDMPASRQLALL